MTATSAPVTPARLRLMRRSMARRTASRSATYLPTSRRTRLPRATWQRRHARIDLARAMALLTPAQQRLASCWARRGSSIERAAERLLTPARHALRGIKRIGRALRPAGPAATAAGLTRHFSGAIPYA